MLCLIWVVFIIVPFPIEVKANLTGEFHLLVNVAVACFGPLLIRYYLLLDSHSPQMLFSKQVHAFTSSNLIHIFVLFPCWSISM